MEYVYAAMLLHSAENEINEKNVNAVLKSAGVKADDARVKALCASLEGVDIGEAMTSAVAAPAAAAPPAVPKPKPQPRRLRPRKRTMRRASKVSDPCSGERRARSRRSRPALLLASATLRHQTDPHASDMSDRSNSRLDE